MTKLRIFSALTAAAVFVLACVLGGPLNQIDVTWVASLHNLARHSASFESLAVLLTHAGSGFVLIPLAGIVALWLVTQMRHRDALHFLAITIGGRLAVEGLKLAVGRPRPELDLYPVYVSSLSFPSGHAANTMLTGLALTLVLPREQNSRWIMLAVLASLIIGMTRPILGVHWPSDVIGGWAFAILWALLITALFRRDQTAT